MALQHLRSSTANKRPVPGNMSEGQLAMNTASGSPGLFFKDSNANLVKVGPVHVGTTAPNASPASGGTAGNSVGEQWLDTSSSRYVFKIWDGSAWRSEDGEFVNASGDVMTGALGVIAGTAGSPGLYFSGDTNTGVYSPGADQVAISTNGTGRLFVDADGNVILGASSLLSGASGRVLQIGNTSDAASTLQFAATTTGYSYIQFGDSGSPGSYAGYLQYGHTDNFLAIGTNSTEKLRIDSSGRLGLGTSSAADGCLLTLQESASLGAALALRNRNSTQTWRIAVDATAVDDKKLAFIDGTSSTVRMTVTDAGAVGIGTTEPSNSLEVAFSAANSISGITITNGQWFGYGARLQFRNLLTSAGTVGETASIYGEGDGSNAGRLVFHTTAGGTASERARIDSSGRLLVGTSSTSSNTTLLLQGYSGTTGPGVLRCCTTTNGPTSTEDLGYIMFGDATHVNAAWIQAQRDGGTWTAGSSYPGRLVFSVTADGASSPTEAMRIKNSRILNFANTPTYADNTAAKAGGLVDGDVYRKSDGTLMIVYT